MITGIYISQEIFAIDILTALNLSLEHDRKHVLRLLRQYGDQALWLLGFHNFNNNNNGTLTQYLYRLWSY